MWKGSNIKPNRRKRKTIKDMKDPVFYTKSGKLTAYALNCGYVEKKAGSNRTKLLFMEHSHYHVKSYLTAEIDRQSTWEVFSTLTAAKKYFNSIKVN